MSDVSTTRNQGVADLRKQNQFSLTQLGVGKSQRGLGANPDTLKRLG